MGEGREGEYVLLLIQTLIHKCCDDAHFGKLLREIRGALGRGDEVEEADAGFGDAFGAEDVDGHEGGAACANA